jgi:hypothetical protein
MSDERDHPSPGATDDEFFENEQERRRLFERTVPEVVRRVIERAVETGVEKLTEAPENIRELINDMKVPKEAAQFMFDQVDDTKKGVYKVVAKEIRDVLEHINFADEIAEVLTKLQFEINTTIRFVPNRRDEDAEDQDASEGEQPKKRPSVIPRPQVVSKVVMRAREALRSREGKDRESTRPRSKDAGPKDES